MDNNFVIYTDGGARGNPGPAATGAVIYDARGKNRGQFSTYLGVATNNQAEYQALILGLGRLQKLIKDEHKLGDMLVTVLMDSELIVRQLNGEYKVKNKELKPLFAKAKELAAKFGRVIFRHIPREQNVVADSLVNKTLDHEAM
ncbi:ribonuclease HI family protein [Patescibacteria group bacterium]|nr:ribonuclease HI family protein [Patescibacteria group bacterium]